jgi:hypothetical protein
LIRDETRTPRPAQNFAGRFLKAGWVVRALAVYYLAWKYIVSFLNHVLEIP